MKSNKPTLSNWIKIPAISAAAVISAVVFFAYTNQYIDFSKASGSMAGLTFTKEEAATNVGGIVPAQIMLNTDGAAIRGTDVRISFDPSHLELISISPSAKDSTSLQTYTPLNGRVFNSDYVLSQANKTGFIEFSAVTADMKTGAITAPFKGLTILADLTFRSIQEGKTTLTVIRQHPSQDSTVIDDSKPPQNILLKTNTLTVTSGAALSR